MTYKEKLDKMDERVKEIKALADEQELFLDSVDTPAEKEIRERAFQELTKMFNEEGCYGFTLMTHRIIALYCGDAVIDVNYAIHMLLEWEGFIGFDNSVMEILEEVCDTTVSVH